jgi:NAD(P)H-dependent flavin oxidoreductase YrpB (nitropropane dioxygenase family)
MTLLERLGLEHPIVQAGMGGGIADGRLAGAVSAAGGLGTVGIFPAAALEREIRLGREIAGPDRPLSANLLVPFASRSHVDICRRVRPDVVVLHAGLDRRLLGALRESGTLVLQTVGTPLEAREALAEGADGLVVQGIEAGGHLVGIEPGLRALEHVLAVSDGRPLWLAGGIADAGDVKRALDAGAEAAVAGTRFLLTEECPAHEGYKEAVLGARRTLETQLFGFGWPMRHRVVPNAATALWCRAGDRGAWPVRVLNRVSSPLARLPLLEATQIAARAQHPAVPVFAPGPPLRGMPARVVRAAPLYAGETALRIDAVLPAAEAVKALTVGR